MGCGSSVKPSHVCDEGHDKVHIAATAKPIAGTCRSCNNTGVDFLGKPCACPLGNKAPPPTTPLPGATPEPAAPSKPGPLADIFAAHEQLEPKDPRAIIIWGAAGLRRADPMSSCDSYCVVRVGPCGSKWEEKLRGSGRRSAVEYNTSDPQWRMGFVVDVYGISEPEVHVRVYDKDWASEDDFLGENVATLRSLEAELPPPTDLLLQGPMGNPGTVSASAGPPSLLSQTGVSAPHYFEELAPLGALKSVNVDDVTGDGPIRLGKAPLPKAMRGIFWLSGQGNSSALASFAASNDGGGCSTGELLGNRYKVRVSGDRIWASAGRHTLGAVLTNCVDLIYHFIFDDAKSPTHVQIYPEAKNLNIKLTWEYILDFEGDLLEQGDEAYPGSVVWLRRSYQFGKELGTGRYSLVQVIDEEGRRIEPAWSKFVDYQKNEVTDTPGIIYYHEVSEP